MPRPAEIGRERPGGGQVDGPGVIQERQKCHANPGEQVHQRLRPAGSGQPARWPLIVTLVDNRQSAHGCPGPDALTECPRSGNCRTGNPTGRPVAAGSLRRHGRRGHRRLQRHRARHHAGLRRRGRPGAGLRPGGLRVLRRRPAGRDGDRRHRRPRAGRAGVAAAVEPVRPGRRPGQRRGLLSGRHAARDAGRGLGPGLQRERHRHLPDDPGVRPALRGPRCPGRRGGQHLQRLGPQPPPRRAPPTARPRRRSRR